LKTGPDGPGRFIRSAIQSLQKVISYVSISADWAVSFKVSIILYPEPLYRKLHIVLVGQEEEPTTGGQLHDFVVKILRHMVR
jgi:hypothetical protein